MTCCVAGDGVYATNEGGRIKLVDLKSDNTTDLVALTDVRDVREPFAIYSPLAS